MGILDAPALTPAAGDVRYAPGGTRGLEAQRQAYPWAALRTFHAALAACRTTPVNVVAMGDSITEGVRSTKLDERWPWVLRDMLRRTKGLTTGGAGYIPAWFATSYLTDVPVAVNGSTSTNTAFGLGYRARVMQGGSDITLGPIRATRIDVIYAKGTGTGTMGFSVDGGAVTNFGGANSGGDLPALVQTIYSNGDGNPHTVKVQHVSGGVGVVEGFMVYNGDEASGVRVWEAGHSGYTTANFNGSTTGHWADIAMINPQLVIVALGTNEYWSGTAQISAAVYKARQLTNIQRIRERTTPDASIVLVAPWRRGDVAVGTPTDPIQAYVDALWELAAENPDVAVFDSGVRVLGASGATGVANGLLHSDLIHPTNAGMVHYGEALARWLLPA